MTVQDDYKEALRYFVESAATPVMIEIGYKGQEIWDSYNSYGWRDSVVQKHAESCGGIVVPKGAVLREVAFSQFRSTFTGDSEVIGVCAWGGDRDSSTSIHCSCGQYRGMLLRWEGSFFEAMQGVLGLDKQDSITI